MAETLSMAEALQPDILLLDIRMSETNGFEALPKVLSIRGTHAGEIWAGRRALAQLLESLLQRANGLQGSLSAPTD